MSWILARGGDVSALAAFLSLREWECVNLTSRIFTNGRPRLPSAAAGRIALNMTQGVPTQAVYMSRHGLIIPYLPNYPAAGAARQSGLGDLFFKECGTAGSLIGIAEYVEAFAAELGLRPQINVEYHLMVCRRPPDSRSFADSRDLSVRRATMKDLSALLPLQAAYEREEVMVREDMFDLGRTKAELKYNLASQIVMLAEYRGRVVAKGGTNARGIGYDQIGGVFTHPDFRNKKIGRLLIGRLLAHIFEEGKAACLFVKKTNQPAIRLYTARGFSIAGNYRIGYF